MRKVYTAVNHPLINQYFRENCPDLLVEYNDIQSQEELITLLKKEIPEVLVLSEALPGKYDKKELIEKLRQINKYFKIIIIISYIDQDFKNFLYAKGVFDVLYNDRTQMSDLIEAVSNQGRIVVKVEKEIPEHVKEEIQTLRKLLSEKPKVIEKQVIIESAPRTQRQEIISISGTGSSGKSDFLVQLAVLLARASQAKILCIDLNTEFPSLAQFFGIPIQPEEVDYIIGNDKNSSLNYMVDSIDKGRFDSSTFEELVIKHKNFENLHILTGNYSLYTCQNTLNDYYYKAILDKAKELYDFIFIDTSSNIFLDSTQFAITNTSRLFFVLKPTYTDLRKAEVLLNLFSNTWDVNKKKIKIVVNKANSFGIEFETIKEILRDFEVSEKIELNEKHAKSVNEGIPFALKCSDKEKEPYMKILQSFNFIEKAGFFDKLFGRRGKKVEEKVIEHKDGKVGC